MSRGSLLLTLFNTSEEWVMPEKLGEERRVMIFDFGKRGVTTDEVHALAKKAHDLEKAGLKPHTTVTDDPHKGVPYA